MKTDRRGFLRKLAGLGLGALATAGAAEALGVGLSRMDHSLSHVASERNGLFYSGFPSRVNSAGFSIGELVDRDFPQSLVVFAENHDYSVWQREAELIDFLVREHGYDSIGIEGFYGPPRISMIGDLEKDFSGFFDGKNIITDENKLVFEGFDKEGKFEKVPIIERELQEPLRKFLEQKSVPTYGIEDRLVYFKTIAMLGVSNCIRHVRDSMYRTSRFGTPVTSEYTAVPNRKQLEAYVEFVRARFPEIPFPGKTLEEMAANSQNKGLSSLRFQSYVISTRNGECNGAFSRNITHYTSQLGSRRGIVIIGAGHLQDRDTILKETALAGEYVSDLPPLPTLLKHSVLPVYARAGTGRN